MKLNWKYADDLPGGEKLSNLKSQLAVEFDGLELGKLKTGRTRVYSVNLERVNGFLKDLKEDPQDGLLAGDVLSEYAAVVDYPSMRLYLKHAKPSTGSRATDLRDVESRHEKLRRLLEADSYVEIQITQFTNSNQLLVPIFAHQKPLRFALDTGAPTTCLDPTRVKSMNLDWKRAEDLPGGEKRPKAKSLLAAEFDGLEVGKFKTGRARVYSVELGRVNGILQDLKEDPLDGILGNDVLSKYAAVIDFPSMRLYLKD